MWHKWGDPRRLAWVVNDAPAVMSANSFIALYNNSTGAQIIALHDVVAQATISHYPDGFVFTKGLPGGTAVAGSAAFADQATPVGQATIGSVATVPTLTGFWNGNSNPNTNTHGFPLAFLQPGWSIVFYDGTQNEELALGFLYEWRWAWEFPVVPISPTDG